MTIEPLTDSDLERWRAFALYESEDDPDFPPIRALATIDALQARLALAEKALQDIYWIEGIKGKSDAHTLMRVNAIAQRAMEALAALGKEPA